MTQDTGNKITLWVAVATLAGTLGGGLLNKVLFDANTRLETNVQLIELAIGILTAPAPETVLLKAGIDGTQPSVVRDIALRTWAVDTINTSAEVKFDGVARSQLIDGTSNLPASAAASAYETKSIAEALSAILQWNADDAARRVEEMSDEDVERALRYRALMPP